MHLFGWACPVRRESLRTLQVRRIEARQSTSIPSIRWRFRTGLRAFGGRRPVASPIQRQRGYDVLDTEILILQNLQSAHLIGQQTRKLLTPIEIRRLPDR